MMQGPYLKTSEVGQRYGGVSARTIHRWQETRSFPKPAISYRGGSNLFYVHTDVQVIKNQHYLHLFKLGTL